MVSLAASLEKLVRHRRSLAGPPFSMMWVCARQISIPFLLKNADVANPDHFHSVFVGQSVSGNAAYISSIEM